MFRVGQRVRAEIDGKHVFGNVSYHFSAGTKITYGIFLENDDVVNVPEDKVKNADVFELHGILSKWQMTAVLNAARIALCDAEVFDELVEGGGITGNELIDAREKLHTFLNFIKK